MKRLGMLVLLAAFSFGVYQEIADAGCLLEQETETCCVCLCHTPMTGLALSQTATLLQSQKYALLDQEIHDQLVVKSIFNPPKNLA